MTDDITLSSDDLIATFSAHGARLETLRLHGGASLVLHADGAQHPTWRAFYPGAIVGPVANRVGAGLVPLDGQTYQMPCNENGVTALHSGPDGLDQHMWRIKNQTQTALDLQLTLADGDGGLPGARTIDVQYALEGATLNLTIDAATDARTPINIAHHPYWRLGDASAHALQINATHYLPVDAHNIPTGQFAPVVGTLFDHAHPKPLDPRLDHNFCIADKRRTDPERVATLTGADGLRLEIDSTEPGLQVYAGAFLPTLDGTDIKPLAGIALEPQGWPDAVNNAAFPDILCTPERAYRQITRYHLSRAT